MKHAFTGVHLVGSLPFANSLDAFAWIGHELRPWVRRVPDETGNRAAWISTQIPVFLKNPAFEVEVPEGSSGRGLAKLRDGVDIRSLRFERMTYAQDAEASYAAFRQAKSIGLLRPDAKFLFAMPTPISPLNFVAPRSREAVLPKYEEEQQRHVEAILERLPHDDLAIQWDMVQEVTLYEGTPSLYGDKQAVRDTIARLASWVPDDVEMGFHFCEGDRNLAVIPGVSSNVARGPFRALEGPADGNSLVDCVNDVAAAVSRSIGFMHLPTWVNWLDAPSFEPLRRLIIHEETELFLGIVHPQDGLDGARQRYAAAASAISRPFGISTPCGMGRYGSEDKFVTCTQALKALAMELS